MAVVRPPRVSADPGAFHHVSTWQVRLRWGGRALVATGQLDRVHDPSPAPWLALTMALLFGTGSLGLLHRRWAPSLAAVTLAAVATDLVHSLGVAADVAGRTVRLAAVAGPGADGGDHRARGRAEARRRPGRAPQPAHAAQADGP